MNTNKQLQKKTDRLNQLETLRFTDYREFIRDLYATCMEEYYPGGFSALHDPVTGKWYNMAGILLKDPAAPVKEDEQYKRINVNLRKIFMS